MTIEHGYMRVNRPPETIDKPAETKIIRGIGGQELGPEDLRPGGKIEYITGAGLAVDFHILTAPESAPQGFVYGKVEGTPNQLRGMLVELPKEYSLEPSPQYAAMGEQVEAALAAQELSPQDRVRAQADFALTTLEMEAGVQGENLSKKDRDIWNRAKKLGRVAAAVGASIILLVASNDYRKSASADMENGIATTATVEHVDSRDTKYTIKTGEGITQALKRQLESNRPLAQKLGFNGSAESLKAIAQQYGYINKGGGEVRVREPGVGYKLVEKPDGSVVIQEIAKNGQIMEEKSPGSPFEDQQTRQPYEYKK